jgi:hypothetical protein
MITNQADEIIANSLPDDAIIEIVPGENYVYAQYYSEDMDKYIVFKIDSEYEDRREVYVDGLVS